VRAQSTIRRLEDLGRVRLSSSFFFRDFLFSEIAGFVGIPNIPEDPSFAIENGKMLCETLLEPLQYVFGRIAIRSGYRSRIVIDFGNKLGIGAHSLNNAAYHVWDLVDVQGRRGAGACIVLPWLADRYRDGADWRGMAWWIHDHLPYSHLQFFPRLCAFNIQWTETPVRRIDSYVAPIGCLTKPGMANHKTCHADSYEGFPPLVPIATPGKHRGISR